MSRPSVHRYFMNIAHEVATRSTCDRAKVGAVLVKNRHIVATGYNGSPSGLEHCDDVGHLMVDGHCVRTVHAEINAIIQVAKNGGAHTEGATLYVTHFPCLQCTKALINAGIIWIIYDFNYRQDQIALDLLHDADVDIDQISQLEGLDDAEKPT